MPIINNDSRKAFEKRFDYMNYAPNKEIANVKESMFIAWQSCEQHFLKMLDSEEMLAEVAKEMATVNRLYKFYNPLSESEIRTNRPAAKAALSAIRQKLK